jgi:hypothetical protein
MLLYSKSMSEFKSTHYLRFSNRGTAVNEIVPNHRFSVNLPPALRSLGRSRITIHDSLINLETDPDLDAVMEVYCTSNIPIGASIDTECYSGGNFDGQQFNKLVTFQTDSTQYDNRLRPNSFLEFDCTSIPERIEWALWKRSGTGITIEPVAQPNAYFFCTLKIEVYK